MSRDVVNTDTTFHMSRGALWRLHAGAKASGMSPGQYFRGRAYRLANADRPRFDLSGEFLARTFHVGLNEDVYAALISVADQLDVPRETIGELVASYSEEEECHAVI
jgi:hypothetical protein